MARCPAVDRDFPVDAAGEAQRLFKPLLLRPPGRRESFYIELTGKSATFITTFEPVKP